MIKFRVILLGNKAHLPVSLPASPSLSLTLRRLTVALKVHLVHRAGIAFRLSCVRYIPDVGHWCRV